MAIMRTNRLTSKTTPPQKTQTTKGVTVSNKERRVIPATELEAQDAAYKRYQQDTEAYNKKMERYNNLTKGGQDRDYRPFFGSESNTRRLTPEEAVEFNKRDRSEQGEYLHNPGDLFIEMKNINVPKGDYKKISNEKGKTYQGAINAYMSDYVKPKAPKRVEKADWSKVELNKIPTKKATVTPKAGSLKQPKSKSTATEGWFGDYVPSTRGVSNKQLKQFASYASKTNLGESFIASPKSSIDQYKGEMKSQRKQFAKEGNMAGVKATTADIRQARSASKFTASKNPLDVPGMATGYRAEQDNAANRNTIKEQVERLKKLR